MVRYALTIFLSSFLLFQVQPLIGKYILPWFGGSPAVWTTCMLSFQVLLLVGYSYAHLIAGRLSPRAQGMLHLTLLAASLLVLPIIPAETWKPMGDEYPTWRIMCLLTACVGTPYLLLSSTGPLLQSWFSQTNPGRSPYRLYALSNLGSLLALISYPFAFEPVLRLAEQAWSWSIAYAVFTVFCGICAVSVARLGKTTVAGPSETLAGAEVYVAAPTVFVQLLWLSLAACGSVLLLSVTNQMCQEVAVVPFLWVLPLSIYLLTFIICFDSDRWYRRGWYGIFLVLAVIAVICTLFAGAGVPFLLQIIVYSAALFVCCMVCHGELVKYKPDPRYLTKFYLMIAAGGALGGVLVTLVAPLLFTAYLELHLGLAACCLLLMICSHHDREKIFAGRQPVWLLVTAPLVAAALIVALGVHAFAHAGKIIAESRNFYGILRVSEYRDEKNRPYYALRHGQIMHGFQFLDAQWRQRPTSYYGPESGVGLAVRLHPRRLGGNPQKSPLRIGVIGLGVGTMAAYGEAGDAIRFYEINPEVIRMSDRHFSFRKDSKAEVDVVLGDARISLERQLRENDPQKFDVLVVDAFSSDSIPIHLLTRECFALYWRHLKADGILAIHISNRHLDLGPLVRGLAGELHLDAVLFDTPADDANGVGASEWVLVTANREFLAAKDVKKNADKWPEDSPPPIVWSDDFNNLFEVIKLERFSIRDLY